MPTPTPSPRRWPWAIVAVLVAAGLLAGGYALGRAKNTPAVSSSPPASTGAAALDATAVLARLTAAGLPITNGTVQNENTDPNNLLGRPGGYTSRASFDLPDGDPQGDPYSVERGGAIEVFPDAAAATARADRIQSILKGSPILGTEYDYRAGPVLVRITGRVKPSTATRFAAAVAAL